jgi:hypothetical protein
MESQRRDATVLLTFGGRDGPQRAGDDGVLWLKLGVGERHLWRGFGSGTRRVATANLGKLLRATSRRGRQRSSGATTRP